MTSLSGLSSQFHATGAPRLNLTKRTKPLPLRPTTPPPPPTSPTPSSSSSSSSSSPPPPPHVSWRSRSSSPQSSPSPLRAQNPWASKSNWRNGSPPKPKPTIGKPEFENLVEGQVLYLAWPPLSSIFWKHPGMSDPEGHPVVVIAKRKNRAGENCVDFRITTTFGGKRLQDKKSAYHWQYFMQCENSVEMVNQNEVRLAKMAPDSEVFKKRSYVNMSPNSLYHIEYEHLSAFRDQPELRFDKQTVSEIKNTPSYLY
ncbi:hypothetical protein DDE82_000481 [Stemphylium lycopersici]|nr:hypothetical protein TW65_00746 [Stemphylium lycopersici]RAR11536.1 hypothetical protein DDE82_000481 [Stemphylium lycopersici]